MFKFFSKFFVIFFVSLFFGAPTFASTISKPLNNSGLVGYWNFEEGVGSAFALDRSGRGSYGSLTNMSATSSWSNGATTTGQALSFDGTDDYVDTKIDDPLDLTGAMTISVWVFHRSNATTQHIISKNNNPNESPFQLALIASTNIIRWYHANGVNSDLISSTDTVSLNAWHHIVAVRTASQVTFYIDGVQDSAGWQSYNASYPAASAVSVKIGTRGDAGNAFFDGKIDELRIYNRALSSDEVSRLYKLQKPRVSGGLTNSGLVGYWAFDDGGGTRAEDSSVYNSTGTLTSGPTWTNGKNGKAIFFDGVDDYVDIGNTSAVAPPNAITITAWVKATTTTVTQDIIDDDNNGTIGYFLRITSSGKLFGRINSVTVTGNTTIQANVWNHVALVYDGANVYVYLNGISDATPAARTGTITYSGSSKNIGKRPAGGALFNGTIDEVRMYDRGLSSSEIYNLYLGSKAGVVGKSKPERLNNGLIGYWTFDGNKIAGVTAYDSSTSGNNGTMTNGPLPTIGKVGQALRFDGTDDYVAIGNSSTYNFDRANTFSISAWFYKDSITGPLGIFTKQNTTTGQFTGYGIAILNNNLTPSFGLQSNTSNQANITSPAVSAGAWHHIVGTYDGSSSASGLKMYVDGVLQSSTITSDTLTSSIVNTVAPQISGRNGANQLSPGKIDEVRLYNRVISAAEVTALYNMGK